MTLRSVRYGLIFVLICGLPAAAEEVVYFSATNGEGEDRNGRELWRINPDNTVVLAADISPGFRDSNPSDFFQFNGALYFVAEQRTGAVDTTGRELFRVNSDRTVELVADIIPGPVGSSPSRFVVFNDLLYFFANTSDLQRKLHFLRADGTVGRIDDPVIIDFNLVVSGGLDDEIELTTATEDFLYFLASPIPGKSLLTQRLKICRLWRLDTQGQLQEIADICNDSGLGIATDAITFNNEAYFSTWNLGGATSSFSAKVVKVDTAGSIIDVSGDVISRASFSAKSSTKGSEIYSSFVVYNGFLFFPATRKDPFTGEEAAGFARIAPAGVAQFIQPIDPIPGLFGSSILKTDYVRFNNSVYFRTGSSARLLFRITSQSDVRIATTNVVDLQVGSIPVPFATVLGNALYAVASDIFRIDAAGNALQVKAPRRDGRGAGNYTPQSNAVAFNGALFLAARFAIPSIVATELAWIPGNQEISIFKDIAPGDEIGSDPADFTLFSPASLLASVLPSSRTVVVGAVATAFATIINTGGEQARDCFLAPPAGVDADFSFQITDPATNALTGTVNAPVDISANGSQSFLFTITPNSAFAPRELALVFDCANSTPAGLIQGVNQFLFAATVVPVADIIALAATLGEIPGVSDIAGVSGSGVFAVATSNVGAGDTITVTPVPAGTTPVSASICQTGAGAACLAPPAPNVTLVIGPGEVPTFSIFLTGQGQVVALDPGLARASLIFTDPSGAVRGRTSVAVRTK